MKPVKSISLFSVLLAFSAHLHAQRLIPGIEAGPAYRQTHYSKDIPIQFDPQLSVVSRVSLQIPIGTKGFSLKTAIQYTLNGNGGLYAVTYLQDSATYSTRIHNNLHYLGMPVLARYEFSFLQLRCFANAGPYAAYLLKAETKSYRYSDRSVQVFALDGLKNWDLGLNLGAGVRIPLYGALEGSVEWRSAFGLTNLANQNGGTGIYTRNGSLLFGLQYRIQTE